jgi:hypothetical protein
MPNHVDVSYQPSRLQTITADDKLKRALARLERFLKHHPHLRAYQKEIDRVLDMSGDCHGRMAVLGTLMQGKLLEIRNEFRKLNQYLH